MVHFRDSAPICVADLNSPAEDAALELLKSPWGWPLVQSLLNSNEVSIRRQVVRALGNMAVSGANFSSLVLLLRILIVAASEELIRKPDLQQTLRQCTKDPDTRVRADAIRATASVASVGTDLTPANSLKEVFLPRLSFFF